MKLKWQGSYSLSNSAWAERQRGFRNRTEIMVLPIFTTLKPCHIKHGYPSPVFYSVMPVQYLHMLFLKKNLFNLQLKPQLRPLEDRLNRLLSHKVGAGWTKCVLLKAVRAQAHVRSVLNSYDSIHSAHFHMDNFSACLCRPVFSAIAPWELK